MATYHCSVKKGKAGISKAHCDYITREGRFSKGKKKEELVYKEAGNLPEWAASPNEFFEKADLYERVNGNAYHEFELALPNELSDQQNIELVQEFVKEHIGENKVYCFAIHSKIAALDESQKQPHVHIMFSERIDDLKEKPPHLYFKRYNSKFPERGGNKKDDRFTAANGVGKNNVLKIRESWEEYLNNAYKKNGLNITVSAASLKQQRGEALLKGDRIKYEELDRPAQIHLGPKVSFKSKREQEYNGEKDKPFFDFMSEKACLTFIAREIAKVKKEIADCKRELAQSEEIKNKYVKFVDEQQKAFMDKKYNLYSQEFLRCIVSGKTALRNEIRVNNEKIRTTQKLILTYDRIKLISESVYTKGLSKKLNGERRKLANQRRKFEKEFAAFEKMKPPKIFDLNYKKQYNELKNRLDNWQHDLLEKEADLNQRLDLLEKELSTPKAQEKLNKIRNILLEKNTIRNNKVNDLKRINAELKYAGRELDKIQNELFKQGISFNPTKRKFQIDKSTYAAIKTNNGYNITKPVIKDLQNAVYQAKEGRPQGGISANFKDEQESKYENDYER
ncbi:MobA/MobL family protein [Phascolarctobacterium sp.]